MPLEPGSPADSLGISWTALQAHAETLKVLHLNDCLAEEASEDSWKAGSYRSIEDFRTLCAASTCLEQLANTPPNPSTGTAAFDLFLRCLEAIKTLISLKLYVSPSPTQSANTFDLDDLANLVFSKLHEGCPHFVALALVSDDESSKNRGATLQLGYVRSIEFDNIGGKILTARAVDFNGLPYHEPASDIFQEDTDETWHMRSGM